MAQAIGERLISIPDRVVITRYMAVKPYLRVLVPAITGAITQFTFAASLGGVALGQGRIDVNEFNELLTRTRADVNDKLNVIGHRIDYQVVNAAPGAYPVVSIWIRNTGGTVTWAELLDYQFSPYQNVDWIKQNYGESEAIAKGRWSEYAQLLTADFASQILDAAAEGYQAFMLGGTPTGRQYVAALKHAMRLAMVDPNLYVQAVQGAVDRYRLDPEKYGYMMGVVGRAIDATVKLLVDYVQKR